MDEKQEARKRQRQRWRLTRFLELELARHTCESPERAYHKAQELLALWEAANPGEYDDEALLHS